MCVYVCVYVCVLCFFLSCVCVLVCVFVCLLYCVVRECFKLFRSVQMLQDEEHTQMNYVHVF